MSESGFKPAWWLTNAHLQTLWGTLWRRSIRQLVVDRERIELSDGDFIDLDWVGKDQRSPIVLLLHGLEGSIESAYAKGMLRAIAHSGWRGVFMHFRGCSGEVNRLERSYHSGETGDVAEVVNRLRRREPNTMIAAVGFSLGGNVLLKWLGETGNQNPLAAAIAISVPFHLYKCVDRINQGFSRVYQWHLLNCLQRKMKAKFARTFPRTRTLREFDNQITAPLHGFRDADDYYHQCSSHNYLHAIQVPTLLLQAKDDPFLTEDSLPSVDDLSPTVQFELTKKGGHVGFVGGVFPWRAEYWLERRVPAFLREYLGL